MNGNYIAQWCLDGDAQKIRDLLLTDHQRDIVLFIYNCTHAETTTHQVAEHFNISIQSASSVLNRIYKKTFYLRREPRKQLTGGYEMVYFK